MTGLAAQLAEGFGNVPAMSVLYRPDIVWTLPSSMGRLAGPYVGRKAVITFQNFVATAYDVASSVVTLLDDIDAGEHSVARLLYQAAMLPSGVAFEGEYSLFVRAHEGLIIEVHERLDTLAVWRARTSVGQGNLFDD